MYIFTNIEQIMKMTSKDLFEMKDEEIKSLVHNLKDLNTKINLTCKGLENIQNLKEKALNH